MLRLAFASPHSPKVSLPPVCSNLTSFAVAFGLHESAVFTTDETGSPLALVHQLLAADSRGLDELGFDINLLRLGSHEQ